MRVRQKQTMLTLRRKMKRKEVDIPIFHDRFTIVKVRNLQDLNAVYNTNIKPNEFEAVTFLSNDDEIIIAFGGDKDELIKTKIIVHECVHLVNYIYERLCMELNTKNDEPQAYIMEWVFDQVEQFLNKETHEHPVSVL